MQFDGIQLGLDTQWKSSISPPLSRRHRDTVRFNNFLPTSSFFPAWADLQIPVIETNYWRTQRVSLQTVAVKKFKSHLHSLCVWVLGLSLSDKCDFIQTSHCLHDGRTSSSEDKLPLLFYSVTQNYFLRLFTDCLERGFICETIYYLQMSDLLQCCDRAGSDAYHLGGALHTYIHTYCAFVAIVHIVQGQGYWYPCIKL